MYEQPVLMPGILFSTFYYVVALSTLMVADTIVGENREESEEGSASEVDEISWRSGAELGGYLYLGNFFQVLGLQWTTADRAAFLVQLTTVLVPVLESSVNRVRFGAAAKPLPTRVWAACLLAVGGVVVISADGAGVDLASAARTLFLHVGGGGGGGGGGVASTAASAVAASSSSSLSVRGDAFVVLSAVLYSVHVLRLGSIAPKTPPLKLAQTKAGFEMLYAFLTLAALTALPPLLHAPPLKLQLDWLPEHFSPARDLNAFVFSAQEGRVGGQEWATIW